MSTEGNKRKTVEEEEESMLRNTVKYLKTLVRTEAKKESEKKLERVELTEVEVNEEVEWRSEEEAQLEEEEGDLDPEQVRPRLLGCSRLVRVASRHGSNHDEADRSSEEGRRRS